MTAATREPQMATTPEQRKKNLRLALILASVALAFGLGLLVKLTLFGG